MLLDFINYITFPLTYVRKYCPMQINVKVHNLQKKIPTPPHKRLSQNGGTLRPSKKKERNNINSSSVKLAI